MKRELTPNEIKFDISIDKNIEKSNNVSEYEEAFAKIKRARLQRKDTIYI